jgi:hypothetical protein
MGKANAAHGVLKPYANRQMCRDPHARRVRICQSAEKSEVEVSARQ